MVAKGKQVVEERGWSNRPANYGDLLLQQEASNPKVHAALEKVRREGVRNEDILWWWNMHPLEHVLFEKTDERDRAGAFLEFLKQGLSPEQAGKKVFCAHAKFGDPDEGKGDDRPIPIELKRRVIVFIERHYDSLERLRVVAEQATSFNALIRAEMRAGRL